MRRLVVLAWGNESRGDDGVGPAFLAHAEALADPPGVETTFVADFQLQPEHAIDLDGRDLALFVDASLAAAAPFAFRRIEAARTATFSTHGVAPGVVLDAFAATFGRAAPPAYELAIRGETFELGTPLGARARTHLAAALAFFAELRRDPTDRAWRARRGEPALRAGDAPVPCSARRLQSSGETSRTR
jgi:hydrogenase maturation protease